MGFDFQCSDVHLHKFRTIPGLCTVVRVLQPRNLTSLPNRFIWLARVLRCLLGQNTAFPHISLHLVGLIWKWNEITSLPKRFVPETCFTNQVRLVPRTLIFAFVLNDTSYNTRSFVLLIRYLRSLFMVTKDLSNPTIKT